MLSVVKIIISTDEDVRARIIKATNYQNAVELASLRSLDQIQRNLEQYLSDFGWFYERRSNHYRNQDKSGDKIVSMRQLGAAVRALAFRTPRTAARRQRWLLNDDSYREVFNAGWPLDVFLACVNVTRSVDVIVRSGETIWPDAELKLGAKRWSLMISLVVACVRLRSIDYEVFRLVELARISIGQAEVVAATAHILAVLQRESGGARRFVITRPDERSILEEVVASNFGLLTPNYDGLIPLTSWERERIKQAFHEAQKEDADESRDATATVTNTPRTDG